MRQIGARDVRPGHRGTQEIGGDEGWWWVSLTARGSGRWCRGSTIRPLSERDLNEIGMRSWINSFKRVYSFEWVNPWIALAPIRILQTRNVAYNQNFCVRVYCSTLFYTCGPRAVDAPRHTQCPTPLPHHTCPAPDGQRRVRRNGHAQACSRRILIVTLVA